MAFVLYMLIIVHLQDVKGINLMLSKPSKQSSTYGHSVSERANDGDIYTSSLTHLQQSPYWEGDLQGYYYVQGVTVTSHGTYGQYIANAYIGVSAADVTSPGVEVIPCGQWLDQDTGTMLSFTCDSPPVRYVRIWKEVYDYLSASEVDVQGTAVKNLTGMSLTAKTSRRLISTTTSLTVGTSTECANVCFKEQPCFAFSFNNMADPTCYLATDPTTTMDANWVTYDVKDETVTWHCS